MNATTNNPVQQPAASSQQPAASSQQPPVRRSPWDGARANAIAAARRGALSECPYSDARWRAFWIREFERAQQMPLPGV